LAAAEEKKLLRTDMIDPLEELKDESCSVTPCFVRSSELGAVCVLE